jgi:hypothetical protein
MSRKYAKVYPEEIILPAWKRAELARDPNFKDLHEQQVAGVSLGRGHWSYPRGYELTIREEARLLKAYWRENRAAAAAAAAAATKKISTQQAELQHVVQQSCGCFGR